MTFLKWAGGKKKLVEAILARAPSRIRNYHEPFLGGGAVFFELARRGAFKAACLTDSNADLIATYREVRDRPSALINALGKMAKQHSEDFYYQVRGRVPDTQAEQAARFIYLNRTCFNGLYRTNRSGRFNVPFGSYANPNIARGAEILEASRLLQRVELVAQDFGACESAIRAEDFVYCDPPYLPISETSKFTAYTAEGYTSEDQADLIDMLYRVRMLGASFVLSSSDIPIVHKQVHALDWRKSIKIDAIAASRSIAAKGGSRKKVNELLIY